MLGNDHILRWWAHTNQTSLTPPPTPHTHTHTHIHTLLPTHTHTYTHIHTLLPTHTHTHTTQPVNEADFIVPVEIDGVIHQVYVLKRPHCDEFLKKMGEMFECVLFTASLAKVRNNTIG